LKDAEQFGEIVSGLLGLFWPIENGWWYLASSLEDFVQKFLTTLPEGPASEGGTAKSYIIRDDGRFRASDRTFQFRLDHVIGGLAMTELDFDPAVVPPGDRGLRILGIKHHSEPDLA
jgi:hypothetical protein